MFRYLVRRVLWAMLLFIVITFVTFVIFYVGPNNPARAVCGGEQAKRECLVQATAEARSRPADAGAVRQVPQAAGAPPGPRRVVRHQPERQRADQGGRARDRLARLRRRHPLDDDRPLRRDLLRAQATIADRQIRDGLRPDRRLRAPDLDRPDLRVRLRRQARAGRRSRTTQTSSVRHPTRGSRAGPGSGSTT